MNSTNNFQKDLTLFSSPSERIEVSVKKSIQWIRVNITKLVRLNKDIEAIMKTIDLEGLEAIRKKHNYDPTIHKPQGHRFKWLNIEAYLPVNLSRIYRLDLHKQRRPLQILDIGAGPGYFCYLCNYFGHEAEALDLGDHPVYNDLIPFLGIQRTIWMIEPFEKLPKFEKKFDLITAFLVCFNNHDKPDKIWRVNKWDFLLKDLANNLLIKDGQLFLQLNRERDGKHYSKELLQHFVSKGGEVCGREVFFRSMQAFCN